MMNVKPLWVAIGMDVVSEQIVVLAYSGTSEQRALEKSAAISDVEADCQIVEAFNLANGAEQVGLEMFKLFKRCWMTDAAATKAVREVGQELVNLMESER